VTTSIRSRSAFRIPGGAVARSMRSGFASYSGFTFFWLFHAARPRRRQRAAAAGHVPARLPAFVLSVASSPGIMPGWIQAFARQLQPMHVYGAPSVARRRQFRRGPGAARQRPRRVPAPSSGWRRPRRDITHQFGVAKFRARNEDRRPAVAAASSEHTPARSPADMRRLR